MSEDYSVGYAEGFDTGRNQAIDECNTEITTLRAQVEKLTKENERLTRAWEAMQLAKALATQHEKEMFEQLAALAEQNERLRDALQVAIDTPFMGQDKFTIHVQDTAIKALSLPNLATPVLNK